MLVYNTGDYDSREDRKHCGGFNWTTPSFSLVQLDVLPEVRPELAALDQWELKGVSTL